MRRRGAQQGMIAEERFQGAPLPWRELNKRAAAGSLDQEYGFVHPDGSHTVGHRFDVWPEHDGMAQAIGVRPELKPGMKNNDAHAEAAVKQGFVRYWRSPAENARRMQQAFPRTRVVNTLGMEVNASHPQALRNAISMIHQHVPEGSSDHVVSLAMAHVSHHCPSCAEDESQITREQALSHLNAHLSGRQQTDIARARAYGWGESVENDHARLHQAARRYFRSNESYRLLDSDKQLAGSTWAAGGCAVAAKAMQRVAGGELQSIVDRHGVHHHAVLRRGHHLYDMDGKHTVGQMLRKMSEREGVDSPRLAPFDATKFAGGSTTVDVAASHLRSHMGESVADALILQKLREADVRSVPHEIRRMPTETAKKLAAALRKGLEDRGKKVDDKKLREQAVELRPSIHHAPEIGVLSYDIHKPGVARRIGRIEGQHFRPKDTSKLFISDFNISSRYRGSAAVARDVVREIRRLHPDAKEVSGYRAQSGGVRSWRFESDEQDYRGMHQPSMGPAIHDLLGPDADGTTGTAPKDIYDRMHEYAGREKHDHESMDAIRGAHKDRPLFKRPAKEAKTIAGIPSLGMEPIHIAARPEETDEQLERRRVRRQAGDHKVEIHRAAPHGAHTLNAGDWVTPSKSYALMHRREHETDRTRDMPVYTAKVPAKHVRWAGDDLNEFGYNGPPVRMTVSTRGGKNARRVK